MAITFPAVSHQPDQNSSATETITLPAGILANDIILLMYCSRGANSATISDPGYKFLASCTLTSSNTILAYYKVAAGTESSTTVTITPNGANASDTHAIIIRGADTSTIWIGPIFSGFGSLTAASGSLTTTISLGGSYPGVYCLASSVALGTGSAFALDANWTSVFDEGNAGTSTKAQGGVFAYVPVSAGSAGGYTFTNNSGNTADYVLLRLRTALTPDLSFTSGVIHPDGLTVVLTFNNTVAPPTRPERNVTGFTFSGTTATVASAIRTNTNEITLTLSKYIYSTDTVTLSYSGGNVTDNQTNPLGSFSGQSLTNNSTVSPPSTILVNDSNYFTTVLADSPRIYYTMGDKSRSLTAADLSGNGTFGYYILSPTQGVANSTITTNGGDTAVTFNGTTQYLLSSYSSNGLAATKTFTYECWYKSTSTAANQYILAEGNNSNANPLCGFLNEAGKMRIFIRNDAGANISVLGSTTITDGAWRHFAIVGNGTTVTGYLNGNIEIAATALPATTYTFTTLSVGASVSTSISYANGTIDEVAFYTTALSQTRLQAHYNKGIGP